jgi:type IV pilus assembly protein PilQ
MRKQLLATILPLLMFCLLAAGETQSTDSAAKHSALLKVNVAHTTDSVTLELTTRGQVEPKISELGSPARLVLDLPNTVASTRAPVSVGSDGVKQVRIGFHDQASPTTRVVVDLDKACRHELVSSSDNKLVIKLYTEQTMAKKEAAPAAPKQTAAVRAESPFTAKPLPAAPETKVTQPASATDFVMVEPTYKPVSDKVEPSVRASEAASKFVDRPAEVLPPASASMQPQAAAQPAVNLAAEQKAQMAQQPAMSGVKYTGEPISVNLKDVDLKDFFRLVHEISGLNVVLDPNVKGSLTIVLDDVPWDQALDIVLKNNDLARQLEGNVLRIATVETLRKEAEAKRAQQEAEALAVEKVTVTRFLSYAHAKDVVTTIKSFMSQRGDAIADERTNAVIINDIPAVIPHIDRLLTQLDRKTQEVEIEARVVAATRSFARDIGTQLGLGWGNGPTAIGGVQGVGTTPTTIGSGLVPNPKYIITGTGSGTTGTQIPLFSNLGATSPTSGIQITNESNNYRIDFLLSMAESRGLLKILSRPRVVTQNNVQALVKQGVRVPIVTQAQLGGPPTVTYVDAFLRLTVTPQITSEGTIFLNVDVENTTPDFSRAIQGNPTLITQQATTQVLVTDGGTVVIGGVIQTQNSVNVTQVPLLGSIPYLGNLFKHSQVNTQNQELIFFITPRIIQT